VTILKYWITALVAFLTSDSCHVIVQSLAVPYEYAHLVPSFLITLYSEVCYDVPSFLITLYSEVCYDVSSFLITLYSEVCYDVPSFLITLYSEVCYDVPSFLITLYSEVCYDDISSSVLRNFLSIPKTPIKKKRYK
jgi:hypothetical protein